MQNQIEQLQLDGWKDGVIKVVEQELGEGRVDVRRLVAGAVDSVVGREVGGVVLPKPLLSAAAVEWPAKQEEGAAKQVEVAAVQDEEADETATVQDVKADEVPKAPADLIARMPASIRQKQKAVLLKQKAEATAPQQDG